MVSTASGLGRGHGKRWMVITAIHAHSATRREGSRCWRPCGHGHKGVRSPLGRTAWPGRIDDVGDERRATPKGDGELGGGRRSLAAECIRHRALAGGDESASGEDDDVVGASSPWSLHAGNAVSALEDLLLFRAVEGRARSIAAADLLDRGMSAPSWRRGGEADLWELYDAAGSRDDEPVAVTATRPLGDGGRVRLVAVAVTPSRRGEGLGQRIIEELADALRAKGVLALVAAVPSDEAAAMVVVQRAGLRPSHVERSSADNDGRDVVWFDLQL